MDYREEMKQLRETLNANGYLYYVLDAPTMSDYEYDHLLRRLEDLEKEHPEEITPDSPTQRVGGKLLSQFEEVRHEVPLGSLQDVFSFDELRDFDAHVREEEPDAEYSVEPKVDGLSVALEYVNGVYTRGSTRGDGITGETVHTPPSAECLPAFISDLCTFFNDTKPAQFIHPIIRAIIIHYLIGYFHPFADGNGRTARALFYWYMLKSGYRFVQYLSISRVIKGSKRGYEKAYLFAEQDSNDLGYFIQYNLNVLQKSFEDLRRYLTRKSKEKINAGRLLLLGNITPRQAEILNRYIAKPDEVLTAADTAGFTGVSQGTAKSDLKDLTQKNYLSEIPLNGKTKAYIRSARFVELIQGASATH